MDRIEPRSANDYNDRTTSAVRRVLVEIGHSTSLNCQSTLSRAETNMQKPTK